MPDPGNPQTLNRYSYALNNPVRHNDPNGHCPICFLAAGGAVIGAAIGYGNQVYNNYQNNGGNLGAALTTNIDPDPIVKGAFLGGAAGSALPLVAAGTAAIAPLVTGGAAAACADGDCTNEAIAAASEVETISSTAAANIEQDVLAGQVEAARAAQQAVGNTGPNRATIATLSDSSITTHSGWLNRPGYTQGTNQAFQLADELGYQFRAAGGADHGVPGRFFASHAEAQLAALAPNAPIGVSNNMCGSCQEFFRQIAQYNHVAQVVADPDKVYIFYPDGTIGIQ